MDAYYGIYDADVVIIGPGTLHSSQYPTMMHEGFSDAIKGKPVVIVVNLECDNSMHEYSAEAIVAEMRSTYGLQDADDVTAIVCDGAPLPYSIAHLNILCQDVRIGKYAASTDPWKHDGGEVLNAILS
jgi:2-phospho-L-lactate transferase/gluconeogenesis factor (CofD/UPF0052 family)